MIPDVKIFGFTIFSRKRLGVRQSLTVGSRLSYALSREFIRQNPTFAFFIFLFLILIFVSLVVAVVWQHLEVTINSTTIKLVQGDITELTVNAIVNAANSSLILGGGVAGAIIRKGGSRIQEECNQIGYSPTGTAVITTGGNLKANYVIHAVGPTDDLPDRDDLLKNAVKSAINLAQDHNLSSMALPAISTGIFGFPLEPASKIIVETCVEEAKIQSENQKLREIVICLYDKSTYDVFQDTLKNLISEK